MVQGKFVELGKTGIQISPIGLGIMQWGDVSIDPENPTIYKDILQIYQDAQEVGINFFDTAEAYGSGKSEIQLGLCLKQATFPDIVVATKFMPYPWRLSKGELRAALMRSLKRLGLSRVDLYQMHWPTPLLSIQSWMDAMADVVADGLIRAVGVSNYSPNQTKVAFEALARRKIPLASNQVKYSLLDRRPERSGLIELCNKLGITIIAYSPLEKGILTGKYSPGNLPNGFRAWIYNKGYMMKISPLLEELRQIGQAHHGMTSGQAALNWVTSNGAVPIPGARNRTQAQENMRAVGWQLSSEEVARLDQLSDEVFK
jgi:aryl-alcohol dehydrogenase-like predicted oxidoreductase